MKTVSIHDAKTNLSKYIAAVKKGEAIYIGGFGKPEVMLVKITQDNKKSGVRDLTPLYGKITASSDAFSKEFDKEIADLMTNDGKL